MAKKNKTAKFLGSVFRFFWHATVNLFKWVFVSLPMTIILAAKYAKNPDEKEKIDRKLEVEKKQEVHDERIERVERLIYSVYNDPEYSKSDKGKHDLKTLGERVK